MRLPIVGMLVVATAIVSGGAVWLGLQQRPDLLGLPPARVAPAKADPPVRRADGAVAALGRLEPESAVVDVNVPPGSRVEKLLVKEHDRVAANAPLAQLDTHDELLAARDHARALHDEARARFDAESVHGRAGIETARLKLQEATEVHALGVESEQARLRQVEAELEKAKVDLARSARMLADRAIPQSQHDAAKLAVEQLTEQRDQRTAAVAQLARAREVKIALARAELAGAESDLARIQKGIPLASLKAAAELAAARFSRTIVRAPFAGEVLTIQTHVGETTGAAPILKLGDTSRMFVIAEVYETDAARVAKGQPVSVTSKAFPPGTTLKGTVESLSALVHRKDVLSIDPAADRDARVLEARIRLADSALAARFNHLQVDVTIEVGVR